MSGQFSYHLKDSRELILEPEIDLQLYLFRKAIDEVTTGLGSKGQMWSGLIDPSSLTSGPKLYKFWVPLLPC